MFPISWSDRLRGSITTHNNNAHRCTNFSVALTVAVEELGNFRSTESVGNIHTINIHNAVTRRNLSEEQRVVLGLLNERACLVTRL